MQWWSWCKYVCASSIDREKKIQSDNKWNECAKSSETSNENENEKKTQNRNIKLTKTLRNLILKILLLYS